MHKLTLIATALVGLSSLSAQAAEKIRFGLNWLPQAEMCGFYQAKATGLYDKAGLDVDIIPGGPDRNIPLIVASGELDLAMGSSFTTLNMVNQKIPAKTIAAYLQKDPQTLVAHADQGVKTLADLKGRPIMVAKFSQAEFWQFLKQKHGFSDSQLRPYTYSAAPFLNNPKAVQQGYITEDAMLLGKELPKPPVSILLADYGYQNYATTVFGMNSTLEKRKAAVAAFIDASRQGWEQCVQGDYTPALKATLVANPQHGEPLYHFKMKQMRELGLIDSGDAKKGGLGAMSDARWKAFFTTMAAAGVYPAKLDYKAAYTLDFVSAGPAAGKSGEK
ncbi:ABC transporter substrate-binding protein [Uliginosibacterium sp. H3]|uniref:ABC transporter substrate-binding protein n=1 Tax=Uliginosibacterium silvisoli TaxID=3114758 RepID=A0ABU6K2C5_9RHOO|nr:ABC transporter substrate-binding protein [Uliginosibacterium sp. H3]